MLNLLLEDPLSVVVVLLTSLLGPVSLLARTSNIYSRAPAFLLLSVSIGVAVAIHSAISGAQNALHVNSPGGQWLPFVYAINSGLALLFVSSLGVGLFAIVWIARGERK